LLGDERRPGGDLFRLNCASCHNFTGKGGALSSGKYAPDLRGPNLRRSTRDADSGPQNMPQVSPTANSLPMRSATSSPTSRMAAEAPTRRLRPRRLRTASEGMAIWIIGIVAVIGAACGSERGMSDATSRDGHPGQRRPGSQRRRTGAMSREELVELGGKIDGVETSSRKTAGRFPAPRPRSGPSAGGVLASAGRLFGLALLLIFLFWPWEYKGGERGHFWYDLATPLYGLTFGLSILAIGIGAVLYQKKFIPEEISIQDRHDGAPRDPPQDRRGQPHRCAGGSTLKRRKLIGLSLGIGLGAFGLGTLVAFIGGLIKNPWKPVVPTADGKKAVLWTSGWTPRFKGETIFWPAPPASRRSPFVKMRPRTSTRAAWRPCSRGGVRRRRHHRRVTRRLSEIAMGVRNPVMLIRIKPATCQGGQTQGPGELQLRRAVRVHQGVLALGLPLFALRATDLSHPLPVPPVAVRRVALREPIFGPAARALAQLPITIDQDGYLVANGDFIEPVGPAFWERRS
jgi:ubiquinol-cytochrome c reductase iron-sulfur subunit